jgi:hypothetical protein
MSVEPAGGPGGFARWIHCYGLTGPKHRVLTA